MCLPMTEAELLAQPAEAYMNAEQQAFFRDQEFSGDQGSRAVKRIRDVRAGPDGALYLLTDSAKGRVLRVVPAAAD